MLAQVWDLLDFDELKTVAKSAPLLKVTNFEWFNEKNRLAKSESSKPNATKLKETWLILSQGVPTDSGEPNHFCREQTLSIGRVFIDAGSTLGGQPGFGE